MRCSGSCATLRQSVSGSLIYIVYSASQVIIQPNSGFDSVPADLGALFTATECVRRTGKPVERIVAGVTMNGALSGGTLGTGMLMEKEGLQAQIDRPFLLGGQHVGEGELHMKYTHSRGDLRKGAQARKHVWAREERAVTKLQRSSGRCLSLSSGRSEM